MEPKRASQTLVYARKNSNGRQFLFEDFAETKPVAKEDAYKNEYAIEVEIKAYFDDEKLTKGIFAIFHRGIKSGLRSDLGDTFSRNDKAWEGFDFTDGRRPSVLERNFMNNEAKKLFIENYFNRGDCDGLLKKQK